MRSSAGASSWGRGQISWGSRKSPWHQTWKQLLYCKLSALWWLPTACNIGLKLCPHYSRYLEFKPILSIFFTYLWIRTNQTTSPPHTHTHVFLSQGSAHDFSSAVTFPISFTIKSLPTLQGPVHRRIPAYSLSHLMRPQLISSVAVLPHSSACPVPPGRGVAASQGPPCSLGMLSRGQNQPSVSPW